MVYRRHTNFATESQPMYFDGTPNFGQRITCLIPRRGDLLGRVYLDVTLPRIYDTNGNEILKERYNWDIATNSYVKEGRL